MKPTTISTVTPVYSGAKYLPILVEKLNKLRNRWNSSDSPIQFSESIFVDDESIDLSSEVLENISAQYDWIRVIKLSKNFGQHPATIAGILHTSSDWVVTLDEDCQHDTDFLIEMFRIAVKNSFDIVYAKPKKGPHNSYLRDLSSRLFKKLMVFITGNKFITKYNSFRFVRGEIARAAASVCAHDTYFDNALCWFTQRISSLEIEMRDLRFMGQKESGYSYRKLLSHSRRMIISSDNKLLRSGIFLGTTAVIFSIFVSIYLYYNWLISPETISVRGWVSTILILCFFGGFLSLMMGIVLEYIIFIMKHFQGKPSFFIVDRSMDKTIYQYFIKSNQE